MSKKNLSALPMRPPVVDAKSQFIEQGIQAPTAPEPVVSQDAVSKREERVTVYLTKEEYKRVRLYALETEQKVTSIFRDAVMQLVEAHEAGRGS